MHLLETTQVLLWSRPLDKCVNWLADHQEESQKGYHRKANFQVKGLYKEAKFNNINTWFFDSLWEPDKLGMNIALKYESVLQGDFHDSQKVKLKGWLDQTTMILISFLFQ